MSGIWYKNNEDGSSNVSIMFLVRSGGIDFDREENRLLKDVFVGYLEDQFILERNFETRTPQLQFFVESQGFSTKIQAKNAKDMCFILETFFDLFPIDVDLEINRHIFDNHLTLNDMKNFVDKFFVTVHFEFFFDGNIDKMTANQTIGSIINKTTLHFHSSPINELNVYPMKALPKKMVIRKSIQNLDHNCVMIAFKITSIYSSWDRFAGDLLDGFLSTDFVVKYQMQNQDHQIKYVRLPGIVGNYMLFLMTGNHNASLLEQKLEDFLQTIISYVQHSEPGEFRKFANYAIMKYENRPMWFKNWFMIKKGYYDFDFHRNFAERLLMHNTRHVQEFIEKFLKSDAPTHARLTWPVLLFRNNHPELDDPLSAQNNNQYGAEEI
uniref:Peptidase M16 C-terminal domain-containing protein n=1 Tax=Romanomermis culicivorax TaxID=13658 RepID=A0A915KQF5_ROMCU